MVDFHFAPHFQSPHPESAAIDKVVAYFEENKMKYQTLRDGEALVIEDQKLSLVGASNG